MTEGTPLTTRLARWLGESVDARGLAAFRIAFGGLMLFSTVRFWAYGWIDELLVQPTYHFTYAGFDWVRPWPAWGMYAHFVVMALAALCVMLGAWTRRAAAVFFFTFTYAELIEKSAYLNHYVLVSLLALLLCFVRSGAAWSVDAWRRGESRSVPRWSYAILRSQIAIVYFFAGFAKLNADWLFRAEPLATWLQSFTDLPIVGPAMGQLWLAFAMSWIGAIYDLSIFAWLSWRRTRPVAVVASLVFHITIWLLFPVGVFSWVMLISITIFFDPAWPMRAVTWLASRLPRWRRLALPAARATAPHAGRGGLRRGWVLLAIGYFAVQIAVPLRFVAFPGNVNWTEEGFRFAWRVMLIEKTGQLEYRLYADGVEEPTVVYPRQELTRLQYRMIVTQPDMIHDFARVIASRHRALGHRGVRVFADSWVALNGRPSQRMIDPNVDLAAEPRRLGHAPWILPQGDSRGASVAAFSVERAAER